VETNGRPVMLHIHSIHLFIFSRKLASRRDCMTHYRHSSGMRLSTTMLPPATLSHHLTPVSSRTTLPVCWHSAYML